MVDMVVPRTELKSAISDLLTIFMHLPKVETEEEEEQTTEEMVDDVIEASAEKVAAEMVAAKQKPRRRAGDRINLPAGSEPATI